MLTRKPLFAVILFTIISSIVFITRYTDAELVKLNVDHSWDTVHTTLDKITQGSRHSVLEEPIPKSRPDAQGYECKEDLKWLKPYNFSSTISYASRDIITNPGAKDRPLVTKLNEALFADFEIVDASVSKKVPIKSCLPPITLDVPHGIPSIADASNMIFGLQTTISRLQNTVKHLERWLPHTGARLFCVVKEDEDTLANDEEMSILEKEFRKKGMDVHVMHPVNEADRFEQRYFSLVSIMYEARDEKTEWIVLIDDDTFFPSLNRLQDELRYHDPSKQQYISSLSENWWAVSHYGFMGFGGASIILSVPMVKVLDEHKHECSDNPATSSGDVTVMDCIYSFSTTKLTNVNELSQLDIKKDLSGFFESGRPVLSLHHWKEGPEKIELEKTHLVSTICDDCFLQRFQFQNSLILSNAYTIHAYPQGHLAPTPDAVLGTGVGAGTGKVADGVEPIDLLQMEETWDENFDVRHSLDPVRPKLPPGAKIQYKILDSMFVIRNGRRAVRQLYYRENRRNGTEPRDEVLVLHWIPGDGSATRLGERSSRLW